MNMKNLFCLSVLLATCILLATCKKSSNDSDNTSSSAPTAEDPIFKEGDIVNSDIYINDILREQMIDTVVNLGSSERPALFYVNQSHTLDGAPVNVGNHYSNVFRSLTRQDLYDFVVIWGKVNGMEINIGDPSPASIERRQLAFYELEEFLLRYNIDFPLLVALSHNHTELQQGIKWIEAAETLDEEGVELEEANSPDGIFRGLEFSGVKISELSSAVQSAGMTEKDFLYMAHCGKINLENAMMNLSNSKQEVITVVALVFLGVKFLSSITVKLIDKGTPNPDLEDEYASYLNDNDTNVMYYTGAKDTVSPTYKVAYCSLATASFYVETYYDAHHPTLAGQYINRTGMIVKSVHCSWGMHVDGTTTYNVGQYSGTESNPIAYSTAKVVIHYGDCCCFARTGTLNFKISGDNGYEQTSWKPQ